jgi:hypothetical protein
MGNQTGNEGHSKEQSLKNSDLEIERLFFSELIMQNWDQKKTELLK